MKNLTPETLPKAFSQLSIEEEKVLPAQTISEGQLKALGEHLGEHDTKLAEIYEILKNLIDEMASQRKWEARDRIGF
jgi:hypothetical protein